MREKEEGKKEKKKKDERAQPSDDERTRAMSFGYRRLALARE